MKTSMLGPALSHQLPPPPVLEKLCSTLVLNYPGTILADVFPFPQKQVETHRHSFFWNQDVRQILRHLCKPFLLKPRKGSLIVAALKIQLTYTPSGWLYIGVLFGWNISFLPDSSAEHWSHDKKSSFSASLGQRYSEKQPLIFENLGSNPLPFSHR